MTSTSTLIKSTIIALILAVLVLFSIILPAEYNIDPTGIGAKLGLTALANPLVKNIDNSIDKNTNTNSDNTSTDKTALKQHSNAINITVPARGGIEFKFSMLKYQKMQYDWQTNGEQLYFDLHGEPKGDTTGYFESYAIATLSAMKGSFIAPFAGSHGWYWKNKSNNPVLVKLIVTGEYNIIDLKK